MIPRIPTPRMIAAAWEVVEQQKLGSGIAKLGPGLGIREIWQAMYDAAKSESALVPHLCDWPCRICMALEPTDQGHDPCIADLPGVAHACCGHGTNRAYVKFENGVVIRGCFETKDTYQPIGSKDGRWPTGPE